MVLKLCLTLQALIKHGANIGLIFGCAKQKPYKKHTFNKA